MQTRPLLGNGSVRVLLEAVFPVRSAPIICNEMSFELPAMSLKRLGAKTK
jgi:hypothetical protein